MAIQLKIVSMNKHQLRVLVLNLLEEKYDISHQLATDDKHLKYDFGLDSLDILELCMDIEKETSINFNDAGIEGVGTVNDLIELSFERQ